MSSVSRPDLETKDTLTDHLRQAGRLKPRERRPTEQCEAFPESPERYRQGARLGPLGSFQYHEFPSEKLRAGANRSVDHRRPRSKTSRSLPRATGKESPTIRERPDRQGSSRTPPTPSKSELRAWPRRSHAPA